MALTQAQKRHIQALPPTQRLAQFRFYTQQNAGKVPGVTRDAKQARARGAAMPPQGAMVPYTPMPRQMPPAQQQVERSLQPIPRARRQRGMGVYAQTPASSNVIAPRGFGYYDAFAHDAVSVGTAMSIGPATPITANTRAQGAGTSSKPSQSLQQSGLEAGGVLIIVQPSIGEIQAVSYETSSLVPGELITPTLYKSPQLAPTSGPPGNAIPTRCSFRIRNVSPSLNSGGIVRILRLTTGVRLDDHQSADTQGTTNDELCVFMESVRNHARTRSYSGTELLEMMQKNATVVDQALATNFQDFDERIPNSQLPWTQTTAVPWPTTDGSGGVVTCDTFTMNLHNPAFTPIAILIEPYVGFSGAAGNTYELTIRSQFLAHYPQGTMLANLAIPPPSNPLVMNEHRDKEEATGSTLSKVVDAVIQVGAAAPAIYQTARAVGMFA